MICDVNSTNLGGTTFWNVRSLKLTHIVFFKHNIDMTCYLIVNFKNVFRVLKKLGKTFFFEWHKLIH